MQAINRIQNAMINANAGIQGALVVDGANAHRAYPSFVPCATSPVSKCPSRRSRSTSVKPVVRLQKRRGLTCGGRELLTSGPVGSMWRRHSHPMQMPATMWATFVLNRSISG